VLFSWCFFLLGMGSVYTVLDFDKMYTVQNLYHRAKISFFALRGDSRTKNIYLFWGCGIEKRGFLAYFGACQAKVPVRGWCKLNISRVRG